MILESEVKNLLKELQKLGETRIFGGYIRDKLLEMEPNDLDLATNVDIDVIEEKFKDMPKAKRRVNSNGEDVFVFRLNETFIEIVSIKENIEEKSKGADYTINSLMHDGENIIDLNGGLSDLKSGIIKEVNREIIARDLKEKPYLFIKTLRQIAITGFSLNEVVFILLKENKDLFHKLSPEMKRKEGLKILKGKHFIKTMKILSEIGIVREFEKKELNVMIEDLEMGQVLCLLALLLSKETIDEWASLFNFQEELVSKYELFWRMYHEMESTPSRFKNQVSQLKKKVEEYKD